MTCDDSKLLFDVQFASGPLVVVANNFPPTTLLPDDDRNYDDERAEIHTEKECCAFETCWMRGAHAPLDRHEHESEMLFFDGCAHVDASSMQKCSKQATALRANPRGTGQRRPLFVSATGTYIQLKR